MGRGGWHFAATVGDQVVSPILPRMRKLDVRRCTRDDGAMPLPEPFGNFAGREDPGRLVHADCWGTPRHADLGRSRKCRLPLDSMVLSPSPHPIRHLEFQRRPYTHAGMAARSSVSNRAASVNLAKTIGHAFSIMSSLRL